MGLARVNLRFYCREQMGVDLPAAGDYATGIFMMGQDVCDKAEEVFGQIADQCNIQVSVESCYIICSLFCYHGNKHPKLNSYMNSLPNMVKVQI